jgi:transaldolase
MYEVYARRVQAVTPTRIHVNNPTLEEAKDALDFNVVGATTNPTFLGRLLGLEAERGEVIKEIDVIIKTERDDNMAAEKLESVMVAKIADLYMPTFEETGGTRGFVFIQGNPFKDTDPDYMVEEAKRLFSIAPNIIVKLPGNFAASKAFRILTAMNKAICITSCLSIPQEEEFFKIYRDVHAKDGKQPVFYVTTIAGIVDEFLKKFTAENNITLSEDALDKAGNLFTKLGYKMVRDENYAGILLGGAARAPKHFTEMVGSSFESTLNYVFIKQMNDDNLSVIERYQDFYTESVKRELLEKITWYRQTIERGSMKPEDFDTYPPFVYFRNAFLTAWEKVVTVIRERSIQ